MSDDVYVFAHSEQSVSNMFLIEASSEAEAMGTLVDQMGFKPIGEIKGTVDEIMDLHKPPAVQIV